MNNAFNSKIPVEEEIMPSSGFVASVMDAVRQEAAAPQPIAFPWRRALPGLTAVGAASVMFFVAVVRMLKMPMKPSRINVAAVESWLHLLPQTNAGWVGFALLLTLLALLFSLRLARSQSGAGF
jgi:hypothetical protein